MLETAAPETVGMSSARLNVLRQTMQGLVDHGRFAGLSTLVARHGKVVHFECHGHVDLAANQRLQPDSLFRIYSLTKPVLAVAVMLLLEQGLAKLDDPVSQWIPAFRDLKVLPADLATHGEASQLEREITVWHLLTHTAGLGYGFLAEPIEEIYRRAGVLSPLLTLPLSLEDTIQTIARLPLCAQPGATWHYSLAHDVLGYLVGLITGQPLGEFLRERLFGPLGMADTGFYVPPDKLERLGPLYSAPGDDGIAVVDSVEGSPFVRHDNTESGGAGLVSSMPDYARFLMMLANGGELEGARILKPSTVAAMTTNQLNVKTFPVSLNGNPWLGIGYGLGIGVQVVPATPEGMPAGAFGWYGASGTSGWVYPDEGLVLLSMAQCLYNFEANVALPQLVYEALAD